MTRYPDNFVCGIFQVFVRINDYDHNISYNPNIHHRRSIRLRGYDYTRGAFFITICTHSRLHLFGTIVDDRDAKYRGTKYRGTKFCALSSAGAIAKRYWCDIPLHYPDIVLDAFVVMPDHIHGIILIKNHALQSPQSVNQFQKIIPRSIGAIVRGYKIGVTKWFRQHTHIRNVWQRNYYESIIHDQNSLAQVRKYIINNPANWTGS